MVINRPSNQTQIRQPKKRDTNIFGIITMSIIYLVFSNTLCLYKMESSRDSNQFHVNNSSNLSESAIESERGQDHSLGKKKQVRCVPHSDVEIIRGPVCNTRQRKSEKPRKSHSKK